MSRLIAFVLLIISFTIESTSVWEELIPIYAPNWTHIQFLNSPYLTASEDHDGFYGWDDGTNKNSTCISTLTFYEGIHISQKFLVEMFDPGNGVWPAHDNNFVEEVHALRASASQTLTVSESMITTTEIAYSVPLKPILQPTAGSLWQ